MVNSAQIAALFKTERILKKLNFLFSIYFNYYWGLLLIVGNELSTDKWNC